MHWFDSKRNRRIDHAIYTLVSDMIPHYQARHARQLVGLEGPDLAGTRRREILATARGISRDSIQPFDDTQFHVASKSRPGAYYAIDLRQSTCDCRDFPRLRFCKHIAAIYAHFPHLSPEGSTPTLSTEAVQASDNPQRVVRQEDTLRALMHDIRVLSQQLTSDDQIDQSAPPPAVLEAIRSAKYTLSAAIASTQGTSALPHKDQIAPNQKSWTETAERMGVKRAPKRKRQRLPEERGLTEQSIGVAKGKRRRVHEDPYAGGERSGKRAKPDALSAAANALARASASTVAPAVAPASASQPITTRAHASTVVPALPPAPASQPITAKARARPRAPTSAVVHVPASQPIM
jgi:hypothetical protein